MKENILVFGTLIYLCCGSDIFTVKRFDGSQAGPYRIKVINKGDELTTKVDIESTTYAADPESSNTSEVTESIANTASSIDSNETTDSVSRKVTNNSIYAHNAESYQTQDVYNDDDGQSSSSVVEMEKMIDVATAAKYNAKEFVETKSGRRLMQSSFSENDCVIDCNAVTSSINFTVDPSIPHFMTGSSFNLVCEIAVRRSQISRVFFEFEGIHFFGPICTPLIRNSDECMEFPSMEWSIVPNANGESYSEKMSICDLEDSHSGYYACVVELKCCGPSGIYPKNITGELDFPISVDSFSQYRIAVITIGSSVILLFVISTLILCQKNVCLDCKPSTILKHRLEKNRATKEFTLSTAPPAEEFSRFIA